MHPGASAVAEKHACILKIYNIYIHKEKGKQKLNYIFKKGKQNKTKIKTKQTKQKKKGWLVRGWGQKGPGVCTYIEVSTVKSVLVNHTAEIHTKTKTKKQKNRNTFRLLRTAACTCATQAGDV